MTRSKKCFLLHDWEGPIATGPRHTLSLFLNVTEIPQVAYECRRCGRYKFKDRSK